MWGFFMSFFDVRLSAIEVWFKKANDPSTPLRVTFRKISFVVTLNLFRLLRIFRSSVALMKINYMNSV